MLVPKYKTNNSNYSRSFSNWSSFNANKNTLVILDVSKLFNMWKIGNIESDSVPKKRILQSKLGHPS